MTEKPVTENKCQSEGIFSPVAGVLGSLQANEVLKTILNFKKNRSNQIVIFDSLTTNLRKVKLTRNPNCINKC